MAGRWRRQQPWRCGGARVTNATMLRDGRAVDNNGDGDLVADHEEGGGGGGGALCATRTR
jgi:hypothetical protein